MNRTSYIRLLRECRSAQALDGVSAQIAGSQFAGDKSLSNIQLQMYSDLGRPDSARVIFDRILNPDAFSWNRMINAYARNGDLQQAIHLTQTMPDPNSASWNSLITASARRGDLRQAKEFFDLIAVRDVVSWNAIITAFTKNGEPKQAMQYFGKMKLEGHRPNKLTFLVVLSACSGRSQCRSIEVEISQAGLDMNVVTATRLIETYGRIGEPDDAVRVFHSITEERDKLIWTSIISALAKNRRVRETMVVFQKLPEEDLVTTTIVISLLASQGQLNWAREIFDRMPERDNICITTMSNALAQTGHLREARDLFDSMDNPHPISWNVMITAYAQSGLGEEALRLLNLMEISGEQPTVMTLSTIFDACADRSLFASGKAVHRGFIEAGIQPDVAVGTSLINMYGRCGGLETARTMFDEMDNRNLVTWTAMIAAYAQNGEGKRALEMFHLLEQEGVEVVDDVIFKNVIYACGQAGMADKIWECFRVIQGDHGIEPGIEHYKCMADLLGKAGKLELAEELVMSMPFEPDEIAWTSLVSNCRVHGDVKRAARCADAAVRAHPRHGGSYVLLASANRS